MTGRCAEFILSAAGGGLSDNGCDDGTDGDCEGDDSRVSDGRHDGGIYPVSTCLYNRGSNWHWSVLNTTWDVR